ncbi:MAG: phosphoglucomutase/phosphomannomutase family protein, partial [Candidatus Lindowbacteria bacterium]|nr:phosphoglucomutase/phosphomannomutase family protein [Candidatus Lindowbacteria bacterium]
IEPFLADRDTPTPVCAFEIIRRGCAGGINFTASHNPAEYQGIKFSPSNGGPASKELTLSLEARIAELQATDVVPELGPEPQSRIDPSPDYKKRIAEIVDLAAIKSSGQKILVNCLYGTSRGYLDDILRDAGCDVTVMNNEINPGFGGLPPEPAPEFVKDFTTRLNSEGFDIGLATDGDADRFGIFGPDDLAPNANFILALLLDHLVTSRNWKGTVVRSVATSHFVDEVAKLHGCEVIEVPVGFKWIAAEMEKNPEGFVIGGEESGGLTIRGHVPEKDGILACLLVAEMVAQSGKTLAQLIVDLQKRTKVIESRRVNIHYKPEEKEALLAVASGDQTEIAGRKVVKKIDIDGYKFLLDDASWLMLRFSGTEPVIRLYIESGPDFIDELEAAGRSLLGH